MKPNPRPQTMTKTKTPQGIHKVTAPNPKSATRRVACQACHIRKKRCVASQSRRCTYCIQEEQACVPRERARVDEKMEIEERLSDSSNSYNLPLPRGIDHEVPRWSAVYSMFAEVLHLLPPESPSETGDVQRGDGVNEEGGSNSKEVVDGRGDAGEVPRNKIPAASEWNGKAIHEGLNLDDIDALLSF